MSSPGRNLWFFEPPRPSPGSSICGTGHSAQTFNDAGPRGDHGSRGSGEIEYIPFPDTLRGAYQSDTCADLSSLRKAGYDAEFLTVEEAIPRYLAWLER